MRLMKFRHNIKWEKQADVVASYASSSTLARQIEQGAPAQIYLFLPISSGWIMLLIRI